MRVLIKEFFPAEQRAELSCEAVWICKFPVKVRMTGKKANITHNAAQTCEKKSMESSKKDVSFDELNISFSVSHFQSEICQTVLFSLKAGVFLFEDKYLF